MTIYHPYKKTEFEKQKFNSIVDYANKKMPPNLTGKWNEFYQLREKWCEYYVRAIEKEKIYETALENAQQMPSIPITGSIMRFERFQS